MDGDTVCMLYAAFLTFGGIKGFLNNQSADSLFVGLATGGLVAFVTLFHVQFQTLIVAGVAGILALTMNKRFAHTESGGYPPEIVPVVSGVMLIFQLVQLALHGVYKY